MQDCAQICITSADFMLRASPLHQMTCRICSGICEMCADDCSKLADDESGTGPNHPFEGDARKDGCIRNEPMHGTVPSRRPLAAMGYCTNAFGRNRRSM